MREVMTGGVQLTRLLVLFVFFLLVLRVNGTLVLVFHLVGCFAFDEVGGHFGLFDWYLVICVVFVDKFDVSWMSEDHVL